MEIKELLSQITYEVDSALSINEEGGLPHELFLQWCVDIMTEAGETEDVVLASHETRGRAVHGFSYSDYDSRLDLFITSYSRASEEYTLYKSEFEPTIKRLENFFTRYIGKKENDLEISEPAFDLVETIQKAEITMVRLFLITDGKCTVTRTEDTDYNGIQIQTHIWDISRFLRNISSGEQLEDTDVITSEYGQDFIPCSSFTSGGENDIETYMCVFPGNFLADIYQNYSSRLLERNVRAFLSFRSKINRGILRTVEEEPENFIAFNNGLTVTARRINFTEDTRGITKFFGLQIVNGGQTTNTIYKAKFAEKLSLDDVFVPVKLCVLSDESINEFAPRIAEYSNIQNTIRRSDLSSNNPVYRELERCSRTIFAPATGGSQIENKWYFERARRQYMDEQSQFPTASGKRKFELEYPRNQKFDKGVLILAWGAWYQKPQDISLGTEKFHPMFIEDIEKNKNKFDKNEPDKSFKRLVSLIILRNKTYKRVREKKYGYSFLKNVTDYTVSLISNLSQMRIDFEMVWQNQDTPEEYLDNVDYIAPIVGETLKEICEKNGLIANEVAKGRRVAGKTLWQILLEKNLSLPKSHPISKSGTGNSTSSVSIIEEEDPNITQVKSIGSQKLWELTKWAKETDNLQGWQRGIIGTVASLLGKNGEPSSKQAVQIIKAVKEAEKLGFKANKE